MKIYFMAVEVRDEEGRLLATSSKVRGFSGVKAERIFDLMLNEIKTDNNIKGAMYSPVSFNRVE